MTIQSKLSTLWVLVMFNMIYADILAFLNGEFLKGLIEGNIDGIPYSVWIPIIAAIILQIPILMIFFSKYLERSKNRIANFVAAAATVIFVVGGGTLDPHYVIIVSVELICIGAIVYNAWNWRE